LLAAGVNKINLGFMKAFAPQVVLIALTAAGCGGSTAPSVSGDRTAGTITAGGPVVTAQVKPFRATDALPHDPDDPAIWVNRRDASRSLILGTMKVPAPAGGLAVFGVDGKLRQILKGPDRPNNVDVEYGLELDATPTDVAVLTERLGRRLRAYAIAPDGGGLRDISASGMPILVGAAGDEGAPMGIGLYRRSKDGAMFAIVSPKAGPKENYLWQYRLADDGTGHVKATLVRRFGSFSGLGEIEAIAVDDELGYVYYADEGAGIHKWHADPEVPGADRELALFGTAEYQQDREGLGIYALPGGKGYIVAVDQLPGESTFHVYRREGEPGDSHKHKVLFSFKGGADGTDGLDVSSAALGPDFPEGLVVAMNSSNRNFLVFRWKDVSAMASPALALAHP
jgi:3-phytase